MRAQMFVAIWLLLGVPCQASESITMLTHELRPYCWKEQGRFQGFACELIQETMSELGLAADIQLTSFARGWAQVKTERNTAFFVLSRSSAREDSVKWVGPLLRSDVYLYKRKGDDLKLEGLDDLRQIGAIGVQQNIRDDVVLTSLGLSNLYRSNSRELTLRALINNRVDVIPLGERVVRDLLRKEGLAADAIESTGIKLYSSELHVAFSPDVSDAVIQRWQLALDKVKRERHELLARKYLR